MKQLIKNSTTTLLLILIFNASKSQTIAAGGWHSLVVCSDSTVKAFGENATGELGDGTNTDNAIPVAVTGLTGVYKVSGGGDQLEAHSMALKSDGTVWAWGSNLYGGLGNGSLVNTNTPVQSIGLTNVIDISAGGWHSAAVKSDGTVWTWGWNTDGQLGDGTTTDKLTPTQIPGLTNVKDVEAGTYHILVLKNDSTVWAWGDNVNGQVGNGTTTDQLTPIQISGLTGVVKICAGRFFSLAIKADGTVWTWGQNLYGQLGDGTTNDSYIPTQIPTLSGMTKVAAIGAFHCMAMKNDSTIWAWGRNTYGNLGDNTIANSSVPVQMVGISATKGIACGTNFSLLYKGDGSFWGCGRNASGQLGDSTTTQHNVATQSLGVCPVLQESTATISSAIDLAQDKFVIYPNPTSNQFVVEFDNSGLHQIESFTVSNLNGQILVQGYPKENKIAVSLNHQPSGVYVLKIKSDNGIFIRKVIKE